MLAQLTSEWQTKNRGNRRWLKYASAPSIRAHRDTTAYYDDIVISRQPIGTIGGATTDKMPPFAPKSLGVR